MPPICTAFLDGRRVAAGALAEVLQALEAQGALRLALVFDDASGEIIKLNTSEEIGRALAAGAPAGGPLAAVDLPVRLLPRHLAWLEAQPGGPAAAIRRLVDEARRSGVGRARQAKEAAYRFLSMLAGDLPGFEAASRALFNGDGAGFQAATAGWPADVREHGRRLAGPALA